MDLHILLLLITLSLFPTIILRSILNRRRQANRPPGPPGIPIIGNLHQLGPKPHATLSTLSKTYGPLMSLQLGSVTVVIASSPSAAQEILQKHDNSFSDRPIPDVITAQPNVLDTLAWSPGGPRWRSRRRLCTTKIFTAQRLDLLQHLRQHKVQQLVQHLHQKSTARTPVNIGEVAFATMLNLVSNTVFSEDVVDPEFKSAGEFKEVVWRIMENAGRVNVSDYFPAVKWLDLQGVKRHVTVSYLRIHKLFDEMIGKRVRDRDTCGARGDDFLDVLLDHCEQQERDTNNDDSESLTIDNIKPMLLDLFIAGSDTSGSTIEWAMAELLHNPEIMHKARNELNLVIGTTNNQVKESDIPRLEYMEAIVKETLRLHPSVPLLLPYLAGNNVQVNGYTIHKGDQVLINAWSIGRDPQYWDDPLAFRPERFLGSKIDFKGRNFEYLPFGAGRRICPGLPLANRMITLVVAALVHSFEWKLPEGVTPESLDMTEQYGITLKRLTPLCAIPISV
ncbi:hypothetical protein PIB30_043961 [Stylosanthes scabra]|uniref:Uncharacterized protein n=1 Tax=Stylosanthes scabra TaxID=79078 RepID=A0ABU6QF35_9FABA|nr:hypothetical protein [Stylosanthes scabra]